MNFQVSQKINRNKVFVFKSSELEGRLDPFFYIPELVELDRKIKRRTKYQLRDFRIFRASGATPSKTDKSLYSNAENGIPFIRVQNLSTTGELELSDLVYISKNTHEELLKRSQIQEYDLLVKITGVGRMAIASVAPKGFVGNINQHIVVIRTNSKEISENLAAFLNLNSIEKLATKRSTGGTRPALDYPALFSIPVINDRKVFKIIQQAVEEKKEKEEKAKCLLESVYDYLLLELGMDKSLQTEESIDSRVFSVSSRDVFGLRLDALYHSGSIYRHLDEGSFQISKLKKIVSWMKTGFAAGKHEQSKNQNDIIQIRPTNISKNRELVFNKNIYIDKTKIVPLKSEVIERGEVLFNNTNSQELVGKTVFFDKNDKYFCSNHITRICVNKKKINAEYLVYIFNLYQRQKVFFRLCTNWNNQSGVNVDVLGQVWIPLPSLEKQVEIVNHINNIRSEAEQLKLDADMVMKHSKKHVESMFLGEI